jgi:hypothetical protein
VVHFGVSRGERKFLDLPGRVACQVSWGSYFFWYELWPNGVLRSRRASASVAKFSLKVGAARNEDQVSSSICNPTNTGTLQLVTVVSSGSDPAFRRSMKTPISPLRKT